MTNINFAQWGIAVAGVMIAAAILITSLWEFHNEGTMVWRLDRWTGAVSVCRSDEYTLTRANNRRGEFSPPFCNTTGPLPTAEEFLGPRPH